MTLQEWKVKIAQAKIAHLIKLRKAKVDMLQVSTCKGYPYHKGGKDGN